MTIKPELVSLICVISRTRAKTGRPSVEKVHVRWPEGQPASLSSRCRLGTCVPQTGGQQRIASYLTALSGSGSGQLSPTSQRVGESDIGILPVAPREGVFVFTAMGVSPEPSSLPGRCAATDPPSHHCIPPGPIVAGGGCAAQAWAAAVLYRSAARTLSLLVKKVPGNERTRAWGWEKPWRSFVFLSDAVLLVWETMASLISGTLMVVRRGVGARNEIQLWLPPTMPRGLSSVDCRLA